MTSLLKKKETAAPDPAQSTYQWPDPARPSALLVPASVRNRIALARTRKQAGAAVVAVAVAAVIAVIASVGLSMRSEESLAQASAARTAAQTRVDSLADVAVYYDGLEARRSATVAHLAKDVAHAKMLGQILAALPTGAQIGTYLTKAGQPCPGPNPFEATTGMGCIEITASAIDEATLSRFLRNLEGTSGKTTAMLAAPFASNVTHNSGAADALPYSFRMTLNYTTDALSGRYASKEEALAALTSAAPVPGQVPGQAPTPSGTDPTPAPGQPTGTPAPTPTQEATP